MNDDDIIVDPGAKKHKASFHDGERTPEDKDVRNYFHASMKYAADKIEPDTKDKSALKWDEGKNKMVFKKEGGKYKIFHFHTRGYELDK